MPVASTATLPEVKTAPPVNGIDLPTEVTNHPANRPDGKNLFIDIDVRDDKAVFDCDDKEHIGKHARRFVLFRANTHCWLKFTKPSVFVEPDLELMPGKKEPAHVEDGALDAETQYKICVPPKNGSTAKKKAMPPMAAHEPVLVVP